MLNTFYGFSLTVAADSATLQILFEKPSHLWHNSLILENGDEIKEQQYHHYDGFNQCDLIIPCKYKQHTDIYAEE